MSEEVQAFIKKHGLQVAISMEELPILEDILENAKKAAAEERRDNMIMAEFVTQGINIYDAGSDEFINRLGVLVTNHTDTYLKMLTAKKLNGSSYSQLVKALIEKLPYWDYKTAQAVMAKLEEMIPQLPKVHANKIRGRIEAVRPEFLASKFSELGQEDKDWLIAWTLNPDDLDFCRALIHTQSNGAFQGFITIVKDTPNHPGLAWINKNLSYFDPTSLTSYWKARTLYKELGLFADYYEHALNKPK